MIGWLILIGIVIIILITRYIDDKSGYERCYEDLKAKGYTKDGSCDAFYGDIMCKHCPHFDYDKSVRQVRK